MQFIIVSIVHNRSHSSSHPSPHTEHLHLKTRSKNYHTFLFLHWHNKNQFQIQTHSITRISCLMGRFTSIQLLAYLHFTCIFTPFRLCPRVVPLILDRIALCLLNSRAHVERFIMRSIAYHLEYVMPLRVERGGRKHRQSKWNE